jgi:hypothetical protein
MNEYLAKAKSKLFHAGSSKWAFAAITIVSVLVILGIVASQHDALVSKAISSVRPGMGQSELVEVLRPLKADLPIRSKRDSNASYMFRGVDEFVVIVMDGVNDDAKVAAVNHIPDVGPVWERARRNWESRFR